MSVEPTMSVNTTVVRIRSPVASSGCAERADARPGDADPRLVAHDPRVVPGRDLVDDSGPTSIEVPSDISMWRRPATTSPKWWYSHHSVPASGLTCSDQRQPGSMTWRPMDDSPRWTSSMLAFSTVLTSSGLSKRLRRSCTRESYET